jgi:myotubularin-related protein 6/7/8
MHTFRVVVAENILCISGVPVLVHCSGGWDRTTHAVALAKLIADNYYRTIKVSIKFASNGYVSLW